jgi:predicted DNA-binding transcriptional regulator AlpA
MTAFDPRLAEQLAIILERIAHELRQSAGTSTNALALLGAAEGSHGRAKPRPAMNTLTTTSDLMTAGDVAKLLHLDVRTVRRMRLMSQIPDPVRIGNALRWRRRDIERWIEERAP